MHEAGRLTGESGPSLLIRCVVSRVAARVGNAVKELAAAGSNPATTPFELSASVSNEPANVVAPVCKAWAKGDLPLYLAACVVPSA